MAVGPYIQLIQGGMRAWFEQYRPKYALQMPDEPGFAQFLKGLGCQVIGRVHTDDQKWDRPHQFAQEMYDRIMRKAMVRDVWAWMGGNEPNSDRIRESAEFDLDLLGRLAREEILYVPGSYSVGVPDYPEWSYPEIIELCRIADYIGVHEYCAPRMDSEFIEKPQMDPFVGGHFTMRHRFALEHLARHMQPGQLPKVLILESGIDSGIDAPWNIPSQGGWKSFTDISDYMSQIEWMHRHMSAEALIVFIMGTYYNEGAKWPTYDVWHPPEAREAFGQLIARLNGTTPPPPPPPDPQPGPDPCNPGDPVPSVVGGIDVSQHQGLIDWETVANSKTVERVIIRASSGTRTDRRFYENWSGAGAAGILRGAYHYLYPGDEAEQAYLFFRMADLLYPEIGYVLDVEQSGLTAANVLAFIEAWGRMSPAKLIIYTSPGLWHELIGHDAQWAKSHKLWVAHWDVDEPTLPDPWEDWVIWQYTVAPAGTIPGISTAIDLDWFRV